MRSLLLIPLLATCLLPLRATEYIVNGDFSEGVGHWYGDARAPTEFARDNNLMTPDAAFSKGVMLPLKNRNWIKFAQDFQGKIAGGTITIKYQLSPDCVFSEKADDFQNVPHSIKYDGWMPFSIEPGRWMVFISDFGTSRGMYAPIEAKAGTDVQTFRMKISRLTPHEDKTITLAFPPGTGTVVLLSVSFDDGAEAAPAPPDPNAIPKL